MKEIQKYIHGNSLIVGAVALSCLLIFIAFITNGNDDLHWSLDFLGSFHPLLVHLPIGLLIGLFALEVLNIYRPSLHLQPACSVLLWLSVLSSIPTIIAGSLLAASGGYGSQVLSIHRWLGLTTGLLSVWLLVIRQYALLVGNRKFTSYHALLLVNVLILGVTGHYGGSLTHGSNYLTKNLPSEIRIFFGDDPFATDGLAKMKSSKIDETLSSYTFAHNIQPITASYCYDCHGKKEQKD